MDDKRPKHNLGTVEGRVEKVKKSPLRKFAAVLFEEDLPSVGNSVVKEIVEPTIKDFLADILIGSIERAFYGRGRTSGSPRTNTNSLVRSSVYPQQGYTAYNQASNKPALPPSTPATMLNFEDITTMRSRSAATDLLERLRSAIVSYGNVSVCELYDILQMPDDLDFTYNYYGWTNLANVPIRANASGWWLDLPRPQPLRTN